jgi:hypothetical protein
MLLKRNCLITVSKTAYPMTFLIPARPEVQQKKKKSPLLQETTNDLQILPHLSDYQSNSHKIITPHYKNSEKLPCA